MELTGRGGDERLHLAAPLAMALLEDLASLPAAGSRTWPGARASKGAEKVEPGRLARAGVARGRLARGRSCPRPPAHQLALT